MKIRSDKSITFSKNTTQGPDASSQESTTRHERDEIANIAQAQDAEAEARVAELVEDTNYDQDGETEHPTDPEVTTAESDQRVATTTTESEPETGSGQEPNASSGQTVPEPEAHLNRPGVVPESAVTMFIPSPAEAINTAAALAQARAYNARAGYAYAIAGYADANEHADTGADRAANRQRPTGDPLETR